ncbi:hypothetical protein HanIR_Chr17g0863461 [Helianthus annuus]|nr:hypothetical protein HanIR_Chr17g0863461 [Helianthus annuus]
MFILMVMVDGFPTFGDLGKWSAAGGSGGLRRRMTGREREGLERGGG